MFERLRRLFESKEQTRVRLKREAEDNHRRRVIELRQRIVEHKRELRERLERKLREERERKAAKLKDAKNRKKLAEKIKQAKQFVKAQKLRRTRRDGKTVYVNQDGDIVNYMILYYLLFHTNNERFGRDSDYYTPVVSNVVETQQDSSSDWSGSFGGGSSGGGGASSSWDSGSISSGSDFGGSFGGGDSGGSSGASGSW